MHTLKRVGIILLLIAGAMSSLIGILSITRGTPVRRVMAMGGGDASIPSVRDSLFVRTMELYTGTHLEPGNHVDILANGNDTYPRLWRDIASARHTVTVQMYYSKPGKVADSLAHYLIGRARAKVRVLLLLDAFGSQDLTRGWLDSVKASGVELALLRPIHWYSLHKAADRSHARIVVVDGRVGYTGGFGLADYWMGDGHHEGQWREANARFEGPAVARLQAAFAEGWAEATGELLTGDLFFPPAAFAAAGTEVAGLLHTVPTIGSTPAERFLALSIVSARKTLYIANSYFVPDDDFRNMLVRTAERGVDVRVLTAGDASDVKTTLYAGRAHYEELMRQGVRIYEYQPAMMHAKTIVTDGMWTSVGSLNFDNRSLAFNNETNLLVLDERVGAEADSLFADDLRYSKEITLKEFSKRSVWERMLEWGANLLSRVL